MTLKEYSPVIAKDEYEWIDNDLVVMFEGFCRKFSQAMSFKRIFYSKPRLHVIGLALYRKMLVLRSLVLWQSFVLLSLI